MTEIPEDVMKLAADVCEDVWHAWHDDEGNSVEGDPTAIVARAILAERDAQRERDAKIADEVGQIVQEEGWNGAIEAAAAIRKG